MNLDSFPYKTLRSTVNKVFLLSGPGFSVNQRHQTLDVSVIRMLLFVASWQSQHLSVKKNKKPKEKISPRNGL